MESMRFFAGILFLATASAQTPATPWSSSTDLPNVDWGKSTPSQKLTGLKVLRNMGCTCGCSMKIAQCRIEDPPCAQSKTLAAIVATAAVEGKSAADMEKLVNDSDLAKRAANRNRLLWDPVTISTTNAPYKGAANPRVTLVEFSDFQCPYCTVAVGHLNTILKMYPNDVRLVFKQFPLDNHKQARMAAWASLAAHAQGKFWPMHDQLYANARNITRANITEWAKQMGLDLTRFNADLDSAAVKSQVDQDFAEGEMIGVDATPTVFVNGKKYTGTLEPADLKKVIDTEIKNGTSPRR